ncbi:hypothetical protein Tco_0615998 [Tanacetum coccineum]
MLRAFPVSLTGVASRWLRNQPSGSITTWEEVILFYNGHDVTTRQILDSKGAIPSKTVVDAKIAIQEMAELSLEESLTKFMVESAKRIDENSNIIKEIRATTDAAIRNQGASIKTLEIQIGQMSKVLQERGFGSLPSSMETNPRDKVKSISTAKADFSGIRRIKCDLYNSPFPKTIVEPWL